MFHLYFKHILPRNFRNPFSQLKSYTRSLSMKKTTSKKKCCVKLRIVFSIVYLKFTITVTKNLFSLLSWEYAGFLFIFEFITCGGNFVFFIGIVVWLFTGFQEAADKFVFFCKQKQSECLKISS